MSLPIQDGWYVRGPFPADKKLIVGTLQVHATKEDIPESYRFAYMRVLNTDTGNLYKLESDLTTWTLILDVPDWVKTTQSAVALALFGGQLEWSRIDNAPTYEELAPPTFSAVTIPAGDNAYVSGIHPNFTIGIPQGAPGEDGTSGSAGTPGAAATITVNSTITGAPGSSANVVNIGNSSAAVFDFTIPRGADGISGTVDVGTTSTGAAGSSATVSNSGTTTAAIFDFVIPKGDKGDTGDTGATGSGVTILGSDTVANIVVKSGSAGDMWIATDTGTDDGSNPVAIGDGLVFDTVNWLTVGPIRGPQGEKGDTGDTGAQGIAGTDGTNGTDGLGWTGGTYSGITGVVTFTSSDGLGFSTGDLRGADGADGADGANGSGTPAGGTVGQLLRKNSSTDWDASWWTPTYAQLHGSTSEYFQVDTLYLTNKESTDINVAGEFGYDTNDEAAITPLPNATAHGSTDPLGLFAHDGTAMTTLWHTQHFGIADVEGWQTHVTSPHAPSNANYYVHPNHSGHIISAAGGNTTIQKSYISDQTVSTKIGTGDYFNFYDTSGGVLRRSSYDSLKDRLQLDLTFGDTTHGNHSGQVTSVGLGNTALHIKAIVDQQLTTAAVSTADQLLINDGGLLRKINMSTIRAFTNQTANEILTLLKTVDGSGSGLDADLLDGVQGYNFLRSDVSDTANGSLTFSGSINTFTGGSGQTRFNDYHRLEFGTLGGESEISSNGTNTTWNILRNKVAFYDGTQDIMSVNKVGGAIFNSGNVTLNDANLLRFGNGGDESEIYSTGFETIWKIKNGNIIIADTGSNPKITFTTSGSLNMAGWLTVQEDAVVQGTLNVTGNVYGAKGYETSDRTLKENEVPLDFVQVDPFDYKSFRYKKTGAKGYGVIAQDIQGAYPDLVSESDGILHVDYTGVLVHEVVSLRARIARLEKIIETKL